MRRDRQSVDLLDWSGQTITALHVPFNPEVMVNTKEASLQISQRCMGPPTSPIKSFRIPELPGCSFIAYGVGTDLAVVQQIQVTPSSNEVAQPLLLEIPRQPQQDQTAEGEEEKDLHHVSQVVIHGQNFDQYIVVSRGSDLAAFSLKRYLKRLAGKSRSQSIGPESECLALIRHSSDVVALSWTNSGDGVLVAGSEGDVTMYEISYQNRSAMELGEETIRIVQIWSGKFSTVTGPQDLISAGSHCWAPAASTQSNSKTATVWWPPPKSDFDKQNGNPQQKDPEKGEENASEEFNSETMKIMGKLGGDGQESPFKNTEPEKSPSTENELESVRDWTIAEQLKHPLSIVSLEWSPCSLQRGHHHTTADDDSSLLLPDAHPALLTVTSDFTIRIWVEVTLTVSASRNPFDTTPLPSAIPGLPGGSHFCVTLVIQPPSNLWTGGFLRASWAIPESELVSPTGPQIRASKVWWITAVASGPDSSGKECERLLVWAVDGLAGVLLGNHTDGGTRPAQNPRAVLWGQHIGQLSWAGTPTSKPLHSASVSLIMDAPVLHIFESHYTSQSGRGEFRMFRLDLVENEPLTPSGPSTPGIAFANAPKQLGLHDYGAYDLLGHVGSRITKLVVHEERDLALTLDNAGCLLIWNLDRLAPDSEIQVIEGPWKTMSWSGRHELNKNQWTDSFFAANHHAMHMFTVKQGKECLSLHHTHTMNFVDPQFLPEEICISNLENPALITLIEIGQKSEVPGKEGKHNRLFAWEIPINREGGFDMDEIKHTQREENTAGHFCICNAGPEAFLTGSKDELRIHRHTLQWKAENLSTQLKGEEVVNMAFSDGKLALISKSQSHENKQAKLRIYDLDTKKGHLRGHGEVDLGDKATSLYWLGHDYIIPVLAVGLQSRGILFLTANEDGIWRPFASIKSQSLKSPIIRPSSSNPLIIASANHLSTISDTLKLPPSEKAVSRKRKREDVSISLAKWLLNSAGARACWHPIILKLLVRFGRLKAASMAIRALLASLEETQIVGRRNAQKTIHPTEIWSRDLLSWGNQISGMDPIPEITEPSSTAEKDKNSISGQQKRSVNNQEASLEGNGNALSQEEESKGAPSKDPYAFDPSNFDTMDTQEPSQNQKNTSDPFAFDMSAFGSDFGPPIQTGNSQDSKTDKKVLTPTSDPYAFDPTAFEKEKQPQKPESGNSIKNNDPFAFDMSAFGSEYQPPVENQPQIESSEKSSEERQRKPSPKKSENQASDPFAFDMSAFGQDFGPPPEPQNDETESKSGLNNGQNDPFAFDMSAFGEDHVSQNIGSDRKGLERSHTNQPFLRVNDSNAQRKFASKNRFLEFKPSKEPFQPLSDSDCNKIAAIYHSQPENGSSGDESSDEDAEPRANLKTEVFLEDLANNNDDLLEIKDVATLLSEGGPEKISSAVSLDFPGQNAAAHIQLAVLECKESLGPTSAPESDQFWCKERLGTMRGLNMRGIAWADLSQSPDALLDLCAHMVTSEVEDSIERGPRWEYSSKGQKTLDLGFGPQSTSVSNSLTWSKMRAVGAGLWVKDRQTAQKQAEFLAKARFAETKDPSTCALFYCALGKKTLLQGLYRTSMQKKQADFLARDFSQKKHQEAACKNAFVLLGQHRYEMAAAFFLLGQNFKDAVGVCAHEMSDPQLALFLCNIIDPSVGDIHRTSILEELLEGAREAHDLDAASFLLTKLGHHCKACKSLLEISHYPRIAPREASWQYERLSYLRSASATYPQFGEEVLRQKEAVKKLCVASASSLAALGAPGLALEALTFANTLSGPERLKSEGNKTSTQLAVLAWLGDQTSLDASPDENSVDASLQLYKELGCHIDGEAFKGLAKAALTKINAGPIVSQTSHEPSAELLQSLDTGRSSDTRKAVHPHVENNILSEGYELLTNGNEKFFDVCVCNSDPGDWGNIMMEWRPLMVATGKHGLIEGEVIPRRGISDDVVSSATSESSYRGTTFTAMLSEMLDAMRWSADPWVASQGSQQNNVPLSNSPSHRANHVATATLASHPYRPLFLSGSATGEICLWQFGKRGAIAGYSPLLANRSSTPTSERTSSMSLFTSTPQSWNAMPGVNISQWGQPQSVTFSECGERFAAVGEGGVVACWRLDAPKLVTTDTGALGRADWCRQGMSKRGVDVTYVGGSSSVIAVGGFSPGAGNLAVWDTLAPPSGGPISTLTHHPSMVTSLQAVPGRRMLISADESGLVDAVDLRMLGGSKSKRAVLWQSRNPTGGITCMSTAPHPSSDLPVLISGSRNGSVGAWTVANGQLLQTVPALPSPSTHKAKGRHAFMDAFRGRSSPAGAVTGVTVCPEGVIACTLNGIVTLLPFGPSEMQPSIKGSR